MVWQPNIHNMLCPWRTPPGGLPFPDKIAPYFQILATPLADSPGSCATQPACYSLGWNRQTDGETDGSRYRLTPPPHGGGIIETLEHSYGVRSGFDGHELALTPVVGPRHDDWEA